jgi:Fe-S-cluster-containing dehydrogenase component/NADH dehydrogenase/NADH:ubiquinone oxidoreductase subunit G
MSTTAESAGVKRRDFLKILGATGASTAVVGCSSEQVGKLIPYVANPDQTVAGESNYYASTCRECATGCGVYVKVSDGRPTKIDGNPEHPVNKGAICSTGIAAVQGLYNPDRYRGPMMREGTTLKPVTWDKALSALAQKLGEVKSKGTAANALFINQHETGSFPAFIDAWLAGYGMPAHLSVDAEADFATLESNRRAYGVASPALDFDAASLVVSFGADFLDSWGAGVPNSLAWSDARAKIEGAPRMVYIGPRRSLTGLNADQWIAAKAGSEHMVAQALAGAVGKGGSVTIAQAAEAAGVKPEVLDALAREITAAGTKVMAICGHTTADAVMCGVTVAEINKAAGSVGVTIKPATADLSAAGLNSQADLVAAMEKMKAGAVPLLFVRHANPVHTLPTAVGAAEAIGKVAFKVSFSSMPDETSELCDLVLPDHHWLESWGDAQNMAGSVSLVQPMLEPVFDSKATADVLIDLAKRDQTLAARYVEKDYREWMMKRFPGGAAGFAAALTKGMAQGTTVGARTAPKMAPAATAPAMSATTGNMDLVVYPSMTLGDGRGANKPWLQELPDPVTKLAWQSWVEIHPKTAKEMDIKNGDHLTVKTAAGSITAPAYIYMGVRTDTVAVALGQGHAGYGRFAKGVGVNAFTALPTAFDEAGGLALVSTKAQVSKAGAYSDLVTVEGSARQHGRGIGRATTVEELNKKGDASHGEHGDATTAAGAAAVPIALGMQDSTKKADDHGAADHAPAAGGEHAAGEHHIPGHPNTEFLPGLKSPVAADAQGTLADKGSKDLGMYDPTHSSGMAKRRWAMTIDLSRCTGCSACVTACYSENNIPTVGATYQGRALSPSTWDERPGANIIKGREMAWLRIERYYEGNLNTDSEFSSDFDTRFAPMMCQHCGNAPCEPVCPVYATYHSPDGLNVQVYNRCVGTRYCSNNCPYKVRYFNWFGYGEPERRQYAWPEPMHWALNPDVTVRGKGVMEKCTFCVQRIREAENRARSEDRPLKGDEFTTACAQACPSRAIVFGDAADEEWSVTKLAYDRRAYHVFEELNTFTAVVYLQKVNHPAPAASATA